MALNKTELAWASGLFEGEGCFCWNRKTPTASIQMTDLDTIQRFVDAVGFGKINGPYQHAPHHKPFWLVTYRGIEKFQALGAMLWGGLGARRRAKFAEIMATLKETL